MPDWVMVYIWPPTVIVPVLWEVLVLASTEKFTVPLPEPVFPDEMNIQLSLDIAVQLHPLDAVTLKLPVLAIAVTVWLEGVNV